MMRWTGRVRLVVTLAGLGCALAVPAAAQAATVSVNGDTLVIQGGPEANNIVINGGGNDSYAISDTAGITAGAGCTPPDSGGTACGTASTTKINVDLGDG